MNWNDVTNKLVEIESLQQLLTIKISAISIPQKYNVLSLRIPFVPIPVCKDLFRFL